MADNKVWRAGKARREELEDIDSCKLCEIMPELEKTCYATAYCHRQIAMQLMGVDVADERNTEFQYVEKTDRIKVEKALHDGQNTY